MNIDKYKSQNMNVDPRMVEKIKTSGTMVAEQGGPSGLMSQYGGADNYIAMAKMPENERLVYAAVLDGYTQSDQIAVATGLDEQEVSHALKKLGKDGLVDSGDKGDQVIPTE